MFLVVGVSMIIDMVCWVHVANLNYNVCACMLCVWCTCLYECECLCVCFLWFQSCFCL